MFTDKAEIKLAILSVFSAFGADVDATYAQESIVSTGMINVLDCSECERELVEEGFLKYSKSEGRLCCGITEKGEMTYSAGISMLRKDVIDDFISDALRRFDSICTGRKYYAELEEKDGGYYLVCTLRSKEKTFMEVRLFFDNRREAETAYECCQRKPEVLFGGLKTILTGKIEHLL